MKDIAAIIFDLDGTLIDSVFDLAISVNHTLARLGSAERSVEEIRSFVGDGVQKLIARSLGDGDPELRDKGLRIFMQHYGAHLLDHTVLYDGVVDTLQALADDYRLAVLTNKSEGFTRKILHGLGVARYFVPIIGGDTLAVKKPDPAAIFLLAEEWNIPPARLLMVGDHVTDIQVGINAGCRTVFLANGLGETRGLTPDVVLQNIGELPGLLSS